MPVKFWDTKNVTNVSKSDILSVTVTFWNIYKNFVTSQLIFFYTNTVILTSEGIYKMSLTVIFGRSYAGSVTVLIQVL